MRDRRSRAARDSRTFQPGNVPEIAAGYWWEADNTTGFGTTGFRVLEGGGHSSFDLVQATVASQPTMLTENGGVQFRNRKTGDANPSKHITAGNVAAGFSGNAYVAGWFRLPDASGDITGANSLFSHNTSTGNQRRIAMTLTATTADGVLTTLSSLGSNATTHKWVNPFTGGWVWLEHLIIPGTSIELAAGFVTQSVLTLATPGTPFFNATAPLAVASSAVGTTNVDTVDWAAAYYGNGIPSLANRVRLANRKNPTGVPLAA